jgi:hypothetical protein
MISLADVPLMLTTVCDEYESLIDRTGGDVAAVCVDFAAFARDHGLDANTAATEPVAVVRCARRTYTLDWRGPQGMRRLPIFGLAA